MMDVALKTTNGTINQLNRSENTKRYNLISSVVA